MSCRTHDKVQKRHLPQSPPELVGGARELRCERTKKRCAQDTPKCMKTHSAYHKSRTTPRFVPDPDNAVFESERLKLLGLGNWVRIVGTGNATGTLPWKMRACTAQEQHRPLQGCSYIAENCPRAHGRAHSVAYDNAAILACTSLHTARNSSELLWSEWRKLMKKVIAHVSCVLHASQGVSEKIGGTCNEISNGKSPSKERKCEQQDSNGTGGTDSKNQVPHDHASQIAMEQGQQTDTTQCRTKVGLRSAQETGLEKEAPQL